MNSKSLLLFFLILAVTQTKADYPLVLAPVVEALSYMQAVWNYAQWHVFFAVCHFVGWGGLIADDKGKAYIDCIGKFQEAFPVSI